MENHFNIRRVMRCCPTNFWARWKEAEIGLTDSIIGKIFLFHHRSYLLGKKSNSNWSFKLYKNVVRNRQLHIYGKKEKKILLSDIEWLNDHIMDNLKSYQSVLNWQKKVIPFFNVKNQLKHNGANHWLMSFSSSDRV